MARSFSEESMSDSHKIGEARYRMSHLPSTAAMARVVVLAGIILAILLLLSRSYYPVFAQESVPELTETIEYAEDRTDEVISYSATDPEGETIQWTAVSLGTEDFSISTGGVLTFVNKPDYEDPKGGSADDSNTYEVTVTASDGIPATNDRTWTLTVEVTNVEEPGTITLSTLQPLRDVALTATLADPDGITGDSLTTVRWQWAASASPSGPWSDIGRTGARSSGAVTSSFTPLKADVGSYLRATATYTDGHGPDKSKSVVSSNRVQNNLENDAPVFVYVEGDDIPDGNSEDYDDVGEPVPDTTGASLDGTSLGVAREVAENSPAGTAVGAPVKAIDEDGDTLTYVLGGTDVDSFDINRQTGQITVKSALDVETDASYSVTVEARDPSYVDTTSTDSMDSITVTITVTNVDEAPEITGGVTAVDYAENTEITTAVSTYTASDDEDDVAGTALDWSLSGDDSDKFNISAAGALTFRASPNFEAKADANRDNKYQVTVTATDSDDMSASRNVTVTVTNVEEPGTVILSRTQPQVGTRITASLTDPDGSTSRVTWKWATSSSETVPDPFIGGQTSSSYTPVAGDVASFLWAFASYTDPQGSGKTATTTQVATYTVKAKNEYCAALNTAGDRCNSRRNGNVRPVFPDQDTGTTGVQNTATTRSIAERTDAGASTPTGTDIGAVVIAEDAVNVTVSGDIDSSIATTSATDLLTYTLEGTDARSFDIDRRTAQLMTKAPLDFETKKSYNVRVKATDPSGLYATINVTIDVTDVDESPAITGGDAEIKIPEGTPTATVLSTYTATDDEDDSASPRKTLMWSLSGTDEGDFSISPSGALTFRNQPDFETPADDDTNNVYSITVTVSDNTEGTALTDTIAVTVEVTNVDETGTVTLSAEQPKQDVLLTATLADPDGITADSVDWQWATSTSRNGPWNDIDRDDARAGDATNQLVSPYTATSTDVGTYLRAMATYTDGHGEDKSMSAVSSNRVESKDYSNTAPMFVYAEGDDIPEANGDENDDVGEPIPDSDTSVARKVPENSPAGTRVGAAVFAKDIGRNGTQETLTYTLADNASPPPGADGSAMNSFEIDRRSGQISVKTGTKLDREATSTYSVIVTATDPSDQGDSADAADQSRDSITVNITITDVKEAPKITGGDTATSTPEAPQARAVLSTYTATDDEDIVEADPDVPLDWSLSGDDSDKFNISAAGALTFRASPNFEAKADANRDNKYQVTVTATDSDDMSASRNVTVTVTNVEEPGTVILSRTQPQVGTRITASLTDPDGSTSRVTWKWATSSSETVPDPFIGGQTSSSYTPVAGDVASFLWAFASYTDPQGSGKTATTTQAATYTVKAKNEYCAALNTAGDRCNSRRNGNVRPVFEDQDDGTTGIQNSATTRSVPENTPSETPITIGGPAATTPAGAVVATDTENLTADGDLNTSTSTTAATDLLTYTLEGTAARSFDIDRRTGQLITKAPLDFETKKSYSVRVKATDPSSQSATINVTINVTDVDESPRVSKKSLAISGASSVEFPEDRTDLRVATYRADAPQGATVNWRLSGDDSGDFSISGGALTFRNQPDYEDPDDTGRDNEYQVTLEATAGDLVDSLNVTVTVTNVEEPGVVTLTPSGQPRIGVEITARLTDPDGDPTGVSWRWARSTSGTGNWSNISGATASAYTPTNDDAGNYLRATASYDDPHGTGKSAQAVTSAAVPDVGATPNDGTVSLSTSQPVVGTAVTASLSDSDTGRTGLTWQWAWSTGSSASGSWSNISGATSASYTPVPGDVGRYLRARATYTDSDGPNQTADRITTSAVRAAGQQQVHRYDTDSSGRIEIDEAIQAIQDFFNRDITIEEAIEVIQLFFAGSSGG